MASNEKRVERLERWHECRSSSKGNTETHKEVYPPGWTPKTAAQKAALESRADILLFGGAAGSLKTETMLVDAARESNNSNLHAIIFRQ